MCDVCGMTDDCTKVVTLTIFKREQRSEYNSDYGLHSEHLEGYDEFMRALNANDLTVEDLMGLGQYFGAFADGLTAKAVLKELESLNIVSQEDFLNGNFGNTIDHEMGGYPFEFGNDDPDPDFN